MPRRMYFDFGGREADDPKVDDLLIALVRTAAENFRAAGYDDTKLRVCIDPDAAHTEAAWAARLPEALGFLWNRERALSRLAPMACSRDTDNQ